MTLYAYFSSLLSLCRMIAHPSSLSSPINCPLLSPPPLLLTSFLLSKYFHNSLLPLNHVLFILIPPSYKGFYNLPFIFHPFSFSLSIFLSLSLSNISQAPPPSPMRNGITMYILGEGGGEGDRPTYQLTNYYSAKNLQWMDKRWIQFVDKRYRVKDRQKQYFFHMQRCEAPF